MTQEADRLQSEEGPISSMPPWSVFLILIVILALGAWWLTQTPGSIIQPPSIASPTPSSSPTLLPSPAPTSGLEPQVLQLGEASVKVEQSSQPTAGGRVETVSFSSDQDTTFFVLYVVPKETYASAAQLKAENPDFADAIILEDDPILVVPVVLKGGQKKSQSMNVRSNQALAFLAVPLTTNYNAYELRQIGKILSDGGLPVVASQDVAAFQKRIAELLDKPGKAKQDRIKELGEKIKTPRERLEEVEFLFQLANPVAVYELTFIGRGDPLFKFSPLVSFDNGKIQDLAQQVLRIKKGPSETKDGLTFTQYRFIFDFKDYVSQHGRLPFKPGSPMVGSLNFSFAGEGYGGAPFSIPIRFTNADYGRKALADYVLFPRAYYLLGTRELQFVQAVNNLRYPVTVSTEDTDSDEGELNAGACTEPTTIDSSWVNPFTVVAINPLDDPGECQLPLSSSLRALPSDLTTYRPRYPLRLAEPLSYKTSPNYFASCNELKKILPSLEELYSELAEITQSDAYRLSLPDGQSPQKARAATIVRLAEATDEPCKLALDTNPKEVPLENGYSYFLTISSGTDGLPRLSATKISEKRFEVYYQNAWIELSDKTSFIQAAREMALALDQAKPSSTGESAE